MHNNRHSTCSSCIISGVACAVFVSLCAGTLASCRNKPKVDNSALIAKGQVLFKTHGCVTCHSPEGKPIPNAPVLADLLGREIELESGETFTATRDYIKQSIRNPGIGIVKGYPNQMPKPFNLSQLAGLVKDVMTTRAG